MVALPTLPRVRGAGARPVRTVLTRVGALLLRQSECSRAEFWLLRALRSARLRAPARCHGLYLLGQVYGRMQRRQVATAVLLQAAVGWLSQGARSQALEASLLAAWYGLLAKDAVGAGAVLNEAEQLLEAGTHEQRQRWLALSSYQAVLTGDYEAAVEDLRAIDGRGLSAWAYCVMQVAGGWVLLNSEKANRAWRALDCAEWAAMVVGPEAMNLVGELRRALKDVA